MQAVQAAKRPILASPINESGSQTARQENQVTTKASAVQRAQEQHQSAFVDAYLAALLAQASHLMSTEFHKVVVSKGFTVSEWRALASLADGPAITVTRLAQLSLTKQPTTTRLLDRMEARGQVERVSHASDRRVTLVRITPKGRRTVDQLIRLAKAHEDRILGPFGLQKAEDLKQTLRSIIEMYQENAAVRKSPAGLTSSGPAATAK